MHFKLKGREIKSIPNSSTPSLLRASGTYDEIKSAVRGVAYTTDEITDAKMATVVRLPGQHRPRAITHVILAGGQGKSGHRPAFGSAHTITRLSNI